MVQAIVPLVSLIGLKLLALAPGTVIVNATWLVWCFMGACELWLAPWQPTVGTCGSPRRAFAQRERMVPFPLWPVKVLG